MQVLCGYVRAIYIHFPHPAYNHRHHVTIECTLLPDAQLQNVLFWLTGTGSVIFGNEPGMVYTARIVNQISFDKIMRGSDHLSFSVHF